MVELEHKQLIAMLMRRYGVYEFTRAASQCANEGSQEMANNPQAVIHRDAPILNQAVADMQDQHFLRRMD